MNVSHCTDAVTATKDTTVVYASGIVEIPVVVKYRTQREILKLIGYSRTTDTGYGLWTSDQGHEFDN